MNSLRPSEIVKGSYVRVVANEGFFDHIMYVKSTYNGFFMLDSALVGRQCIGWRDITGGNVKIYAII
jgi:hypothetical protein